MDEEEQPLPPPLASPVRRRNSISASVMIPNKLTRPSKPLHTSSFPPSYTNDAATSPPPFPNFELVSPKSSLSYTSLQDLLPSTVVSSSISAAASSSALPYEISIRNRLVKQAAWAYLQPMSSSPSSSGTSFLGSVWPQFSVRKPINPCIQFISRIVIPSITGAIRRILRAIRILIATIIY